MPYAAALKPFRQPPELGGGAGDYPIAIVGAGPVGLTMALDLARHGVRSIVLEKSNTIGVGSKAICWAKRSLEILDRLGCGQRMLDKGITWNVGKVFRGDSTTPLYEFNLLPDSGHRFPAFVNLQQYYVEEYLVDAVDAAELSEIRWLSEVIAVQQDDDGVLVGVTTPEGDYSVRCAYLVAADGSRSAVRQMLGLDFEGRIFKDHFLIADIKMKGEYPPERWFWFDPPEGVGTSALLHKQADDVWRTDYQLGWDIDRDEEMKPENVSKRVRRLLGPQREFSFEWISIYTFACRRLERFVHDRVLFVGDSAHLVSPFGARGGNGGIQDADNLAWKLALVVAGCASPDLLESYDAERTLAADENILNSSRATDFMTPKNAAAACFRQAVLDLAPEFEFARRLVNSGRLSVPAVLRNSALNTADDDVYDCPLVPGSPCPDAPVIVRNEAAWLLGQLGDRFTGLYFGTGDDCRDAMTEMQTWPVPVHTLCIGNGGTVADAEGLVARRYDGRPGTFYLVRPDQHVAARFRSFDLQAVRRALSRCLAKPEIQS